MQKNYLQYIANGFKTQPIVVLLGPRQCGKTFVARQYFAANGGEAHQYFNLSDEVDLIRWQEILPALEKLTGLIVIDEAQRSPELFSALGLLANRKKLKQHYLILGSTPQELYRLSAKILASQIDYQEINPINLHLPHDERKCWLRGGLPRAYFAKTEQESTQWRQGYIRNSVEKDVKYLRLHMSAEKLQRFWTLIAQNFHGQLRNITEMGKALGVSNTTISRLLEHLQNTYITRQLTPWFEELTKRQVRAKKIYFRDSGILHALLNITQEEQLLAHPKVANSWEGFALEAVINHLDPREGEYFFWRTQAGAELDLLIIKNNQRWGFEFKFSKAPKVTPSMLIALDDLKLNQLFVVYPGNKSIKLGKKVICIGLQHFLEIGLRQGKQKI